MKTVALDWQGQPQSRGKGEEVERRGAGEVLMERREGGKEEERRSVGLGLS